MLLEGDLRPCCLIASDSVIGSRRTQEELIKIKTVTSKNGTSEIEQCSFVDYTPTPRMSSLKRACRSWPTTMQMLDEAATIVKPSPENRTRYQCSSCNGKVNINALFQQNS
jgi:hypothetical protein